MGSVRLRVEVPQMQSLVMLLENDLVLGRDCEGLLLADPRASRRHLRLRPVGDRVEVADLNSTNGSFLDGVPLREPQLVDQDCIILVGDTVVSVVFGNAGRGGLPGFGTATSVRDADDLRSTSIAMLADSMVPIRPAEIEFEGVADDTITMVFSDIESSTERATEMGDAAWFALLEEHNGIIRDELNRFRGREIKSMGDGFMLAFPSVSLALRFVTIVQQRVEAPDGPDLRVRIGLHTGEVITDDSGDLFGRHVNLAARIANLAEGGQILASVVVREIANGREDAIFGEPTLAEFKGFTEPHAVFEVRWQAADQGLLAPVDN